MLNTTLSEFASMLVANNFFDTEKTLQLQTSAQQKNMSLISYLVQENILTSDVMLTCTAQHFNFPIFDLDEIDTSTLKHPAFTPEIIMRYRALPLSHDLHTIHLGVSAPPEQSTIEALQFQTGLHIQLHLVNELLLDNIINKHYRPHILYSRLEQTLSKMAVNDTPVIPLDAENHDEPVIEFVNHLIEDAISKHISDIHVEPFQQHC